jgi:tetratricopeptide (TPR) repeat protein
MTKKLGAALLLIWFWAQPTLGNAQTSSPSAAAAPTSAPASAATAPDAMTVAKDTIETVKSFYVSFAALITGMGALLTLFGGLLTYLGYKSFSDVNQTAETTRSALTELNAKREEMEKGLQEAVLLRQKTEEVLRELRVTIDSELGRVKDNVKDAQRLALDALDAALQVSALTDFSFRELRERLERKEHKDQTVTFERLRELLKQQTVADAIGYLDATERNAANLGNERIVSWTVAMRAVVYLYAEQFDDAIEWAKKSLTNNPKSYGDRAFNLAQIYSRRYSSTRRPEDRAAAVDALRQAFELEPAFIRRAGSDPDLIWYLADGDEEQLRAIVTLASRRAEEQARS